MMQCAGKSSTVRLARQLTWRMLDASHGYAAVGDSGRGQPHGDGGRLVTEAECGAWCMSYSDAPGVLSCVYASQTSLVLICDVCTGFDGTEARERTHSICHRFLSFSAPSSGCLNTRTA